MKAKSLLQFASAVILFATGVGGTWLGWEAMAKYGPLFLAVGAWLLIAHMIRATYYRSGYQWPAGSDQPTALQLSWLSYVKALVSWFDAFKRTYAVAPGLYYTGASYDRDAPLLVTSNYHLTVFLVLRRLQGHNVRLLVVDSDGINVWCAAGKGQFSNQRILDQLARYDRSLLTEKKFLTLILPKFGFPGVDLRALREASIRPIIGPLYARDLPAYLANPPLKDRGEDRVVFGLKSRSFTWLPGLMQFMIYSVWLVFLLAIVEGLWGLSGPIELIALTAFLGTAYPLLFPWLPGARFAVKGLWLAGLTTLGLLVLTLAGMVTLAGFALAALFTFATSLFIGLSYTGNSAVSNYSRVRLETARFLPLTVLFYLASVATFIAMEVW